MVDFDHSPNQSLHSDHRYINLHGLATHRDPIGRLVAALMSRARDSLVLAYIGLVPITAQPIYIYMHKNSKFEEFVVIIELSGKTVTTTNTRRHFNMHGVGKNCTNTMSKMFHALDDTDTQKKFHLFTTSGYTCTV